jgi:hypothetical protein
MGVVGIVIVRVVGSSVGILGSATSSVLASSIRPANDDAEAMEIDLESVQAISVAIENQNMSNDICLDDIVRGYIVVIE